MTSSSSSPYLEIKPLGLCIIAKEFRDISLHIDQYNRVYIRYLNHEPQYNKKSLYRFQCYICNGPISYFPNSIGLTCTDNYCHKLWMQNLYKHNNKM